MLKLLYIANNDEPFELSEMPENVFIVERKKILVDIVAYCLMPNHIHIALKKRELNQPGMSDSMTRFIHKLMTGYSTYFNKKYDHSGTIWQGSYKQKTVYDGIYIQSLIKYIHLNPRDLKKTQNSKDSSKSNKKNIEFVINYEYSSLKDYIEQNRPQSAILDSQEMAKFR
jgi:REP element-mobilizing transposase RayT